MVIMDDAGMLIECIQTDLSGESLWARAYCDEGSCTDIKVRPHSRSRSK